MQTTDAVVTTPDLNEYRTHLVLAEQKAQEQFDKTVLTLSGGALGISFAAIKHLTGSGAVSATGLLLTAWSCWALSAFAVLLSFFFSHQALRRAIKQVDTGTIRSEPPGGWLDRITAVLNMLGAILFGVGLASMIMFVGRNLETSP